MLGGCRAEQPWPLWVAYTHRFMDDQGRIIDRNADDRTTSEGQAYAMFFALVDDDRPRFDKLLAWTQDNLAHGDLTSHLPAWDWGKDASGSWKIRDENSASDADVWMAYTLLQAGRLWKEPRFSALGRSMAAQIAADEVAVLPGIGTVLLPGSHGFAPENGRARLNPSYSPLPVIIGLANEISGEPWKGMSATLPGLLSRASSNGFAMDWVTAGADGIHAADHPQERSSGMQQAQAGGSYDAIRVYLWLGISDPHTRGVSLVEKSLGGMADYLRSAPIPPLSVDPTGKAIERESPIGFSAAVVPYLISRGMQSQANTQKDRLTAVLDPSTSLYGSRAEYYNENLALFSTAWVEERFRFGTGGELQVKWK